MVQLAALVAGLLALGPLWGINGVAVVVDVVLLIGLVWLLIRARAHVDYSATRLFGPPGLALAIGAVAALAAVWLVCRLNTGLCPGDWITGTIKGVTFTGFYGGVLLLLERETALDLARQLRRMRL